jgi:hypothetical protein
LKDNWEKERQEDINKVKREMEEQSHQKTIQIVEINSLPAKDNTDARARISPAGTSGEFTPTILLVPSDPMSQMELGQLPAHIPSLRQ